MFGLLILLLFWAAAFAQNGKACVGVHEFEVFEQELNFSQARFFCEEANAQLAVPFNQAELDTIIRLAEALGSNRNVWLG